MIWSIISMCADGADKQGGCINTERCFKRFAEQDQPVVLGARTFVNVRWWPGWLFAASLAHAGRANNASALIHAARARRPEQSIAAVAQSLYGLEDPAAREVVLGGLRIAGMPD
jgi:hypothetical protein